MSNAEPGYQARARLTQHRTGVTLRRECLDHLLITGPPPRCSAIAVALHGYLEHDTLTDHTERSTSTRPKTALPHARVRRRSGRCGGIGSAASCTSMRRSHEVNEFSGRTGFDMLGATVTMGASKR